ncbi:MAG: lipopolysaccharide biosynthesis protein, partial [Myxococcota bacterium]|nr:lipopolysaccharide biosynthesis protein [Myxococcota bacterium]
ASGVALAATLVVAGALVRAEAGAFVPWWTAARVALALAFCWAIGFVMPRVSRLVTPLLALVVAVGYVAFLVATREIGRADLSMIGALASRKKN